MAYELKIHRETYYLIYGILRIIVCIVFETIQNRILLEFLKYFSPTNLIENSYLRDRFWSPKHSLSSNCLELVSNTESKHQYFDFFL